MRTTQLLAAISLTILLSLPLNAGIVERDFLAPGDGLLTYDIVNQREWLDLTETDDWNLDELLDKLSSSNPFRNFSLASKEDIAGLAVSAGVEWLPPGQIFPIVEGNSAKNLIDLVGAILDYSRPNEDNEDLDFNNIPSDFDDVVELPTLAEVLGLRASVGVVGDILLGERDVITYSSISVISIRDLNLGNLSGNVNNFPIGPISGGGMLSDFQPLSAPISGPFWLFRPAAVPEPSSIALMLIGATFACSRNRNR